MTFLVERLAELTRHLDHLDELRPRVEGADALRADLSLHNDVMFSLLTVARLVIDIAGELSARARLGFDDYTTAVRNLANLEFDPDLVQSLSRLPGFRNVLIHECRPRSGTGGRGPRAARADPTIRAPGRRKGAGRRLN